MIEGSGIGMTETVLQSMPEKAGELLKKIENAESYSNGSEDEHCKTKRDVFVSLVWVVVAFNFALVSHCVAINTHVFAHVDYIMLIPHVWFAFALTRQKEWTFKRSFDSFWFCMVMPMAVAMANLKALKIRPSLTIFCLLLGIFFLTLTVSALREDTKAFHLSDTGAIRQTLWGRMEPLLFWICTIVSILVCIICISRMGC